MFDIRRNKHNPKVANEIIFTTTYPQYSIKTIIWDMGDGTIYKSGHMQQHSYSFPGKKKVKCFINGRYNLSHKFTVKDDSSANNIVTLNIKNNSNDVNQLRILIFQKNTTDDTAYAWCVIPLKQNENFIIKYNQKYKASYNNSGLFNVNKGTSYTITNTTLIADGPSNSPTEFDIFNLSTEPATVKIWNNYKLTLKTPGLFPSVTVSYGFRPTLWIGVVSADVLEGQLLTEEIISSINTEMSLLGIKSSDIICTGGGVGPSATPFSFSFANIEFA